MVLHPVQIDVTTSETQNWILFTFFRLGTLAQPNSLRGEHETAPQECMGGAQWHAKGKSTPLHTQVLILISLTNFYAPRSATAGVTRLAQCTLWQTSKGAQR